MSAFMLHLTATDLLKAPTETGCIDLLSSYYLPLLKSVFSELNVNKGGNISQRWKIPRGHYKWTLLCRWITHSYPLGAGMIKSDVINCILKNNFGEFWSDQGDFSYMENNHRKHYLNIHGTNCTKCIKRQLRAFFFKLFWQKSHLYLGINSGQSKLELNYPLFPCCNLYWLWVMRSQGQLYF